MAKHNKTHESRIRDVENAIIQLNHFTETIEDLNLAEFKGNVEGQLKWITFFLGATSVAALGKLILDLIQ